MAEMKWEKTVSIVATVVTFALLGVAGWAALSGASWFVVLAPVLVALLVAFGGPAVVGRPQGAAKAGQNVDAAEVRQWRIDHPGATIADAVMAVKQR